MNSRQNLLNSVSEVVQNEIPNSQFDLFIFGSQANKKELIAADIDLGIKATMELEPLLLTKIKNELNDEIPSLYTFDLVDFNRVDSSFAKVALQNIEYLHNDNSKSQG